MLLLLFDLDLVVEGGRKGERGEEVVEGEKGWGRWWGGTTFDMEDDVAVHVGWEGKFDPFYIL